MASELARTVGPRGEVVLRARDDDSVELRVNGVFVMDTLEVGTERALAALALDQHPSPGNVLVGGLGLGFTAREVLADPRVSRLTVVEIEDAVVAWLRRGLVPGGAELFSDDRFEVRTEDLLDFVRSADAGSYDVALLDIDNGPDFLVHESNAEIYRAGLLARVRDLLAPGGVVVVWSSTRSDELLAALEQTFGNSASHSHPVDLQGRSELYHLHLARRMEVDVGSLGT